MDERLDKRIAIAFLTNDSIVARKKMKTKDKYEFLTIFFKEIQKDIKKLSDIMPNVCDEIEYNMPQFLHDHFEEYKDYTE